MALSLSGRVRKRVASMLWPAAFEAPVPPPEPTFSGDGLVTYYHSTDSLQDERFQRAYAAGKATDSWWGLDPQWRAYVICWAAQRGRSIAGDYVECGVHRGGYSRMLADYVDLANLPDKKLYLVDTYCGIPERYHEDVAGKMLEKLYSEDLRYADTYDDVVRTFQPFPNAVAIRGTVPDTLPKVPAERVCYLSIDLNVAAPSVAAAAYFWPRMTPGAVMVLDDYGFINFHDQKLAFDEFASEIGVEILSIPTGQGLLIKPHQGETGAEAAGGSSASE